jgi:hypothetical protein
VRMRTRHVHSGGPKIVRGAEARAGRRLLIAVPTIAVNRHGLPAAVALEQLAPLESSSRFPSNNGVMQDIDQKLPLVSSK